MAASREPSGLPILRLVPLLKPAIWGGRRMAAALGRELPPGAAIGESWELVDLPRDQSAVADGPLAGATLGALREERAPELLGAAPPLAGRFPLVLKFIDARDTLSVQVHPGPAACARLRAGARPKTEAWYVMAAEPGAALYLGLEPGVDRAAFEAALAAGEVARLLRRFEVAGGELILVPAGTVHAIGAGILLAEVQQSSDTTYRVFDWNRLGADGAPRPLHIAEALESIDFGGGRPAPAGRGVACPELGVELLPAAEVAAGRSLASRGPVALMGVGGAGSAQVRAGDDARRLGLGETLLVPACRAAEIRVEGELAVLAAIAAAAP